LALDVALEKMLAAAEEADETEDVILVVYVCPNEYEFSSLGKKDKLEVLVLNVVRIYLEDQNA